MSVLSSLEVQVTNEHLQKLLKLKPVKALSELIWNSLDADATDIDIRFEKNFLGGIEHIIIKDNGHGIHFREINDSFGKLGDSKKLRKLTSPSGRQYHGKLGQGRYSGFVLGQRIKWNSSVKEADNYYNFAIEGNIGSLNTFNITPHRVTQNETTGVEVSIMELNDDNVDELANTSRLIKELSTIFAPYLLAYKNIKITVDGYIINPDDYILEKREIHINGITKNSNTVEGILIGIEWKDGNYKNTYLCSDQGVAVTAKLL
ncbi:ATP-binding protein, partial [Schinkia azotoformans]|uniref:ATP-binding protein n=1 Tax=Schinkia azotoformans TaxID=1454 RepID=UPI002E23D914|nr:ATP-binding protein [Schinkia azotoformans]